MYIDIVKIQFQMLWNIFVTLLITTIIVIAIFSFSDIYRSKNILKNFNEFLVNLFMPLYEVSIDPKSHEKLHKFLQQVSWSIVTG